MKQAEKIHRGGQQHIIDLAHVIHKIWGQMCEHDGIPKDSKFVVFSDDNPYKRFHDQAVSQYFEAVSQYQAGGYVGLKM